MERISTRYHVISFIVVVTIASAVVIAISPAEFKPFLPVILPLSIICTAISQYLLIQGIKERSFQRRMFKEAYKEKLMQEIEERFFNQ